MRQEQISASSAPRRRYRPSKLEWAAYVCTLLAALGFPSWDAIRHRSPDSHPLQFDRLCLRVAGILFIVVNFAIAGAISYRLRRLATRVRKGLCLNCGYDLRGHGGSDRCPECGSAMAVRPGA